MTTRAAQLLPDAVIRCMFSAVKAAFTSGPTLTDFGPRGYNKFGNPSCEVHPSHPCRSAYAGNSSLAVASLLGVLLFATTGSAAVTPRETRTATELDSVRGLGTPRAFVKGDNVRLYYSNGTQLVTFVADWKPSHLQAHGFTYNFASLRYDRTPPRVPKPDSSWQEAVVLDRVVWQELAEVVRAELAPTAPGEGIYFQSFVTEGVIYRDERGRPRAIPFAQRPPGIKLVGRLGTAEMALRLARLAENRLRFTHPGQELFFVTQDPGGRGVAFAVLDFRRRSCVLLDNPQTADDPRGQPQAVATVRSLGSLAVESHGLAFVKNPFSSFFRLANTSAQTFAGLLTTGVRPDQSPPPPVTNAPPMNLAEWEVELDDLTDSERERGSVRFLIDGERFFPALFDRINSATNSISFEVCIFDNDDVAVEVADALKARSTNVSVRVLMDRMASQGAALSQPATPMRAGFQPPASIGAYLEGGSRVAVRPFLNPWFTSDHNKVLIFDGAVAFTGGMNLGREYRYEWHDLMVEVGGPVVARLERDFRRAWAHAGAGGDLAFAEKALFPGKERQFPKQADWVELRRLYTRPGEIQIRKAVVKSLSRARRRVYLENPYLYDPAVLNGLIAARARGVDVRVVLPSDNDFGPGKSSNLVTANTLLQNGVRVFLYPGMTHVKAMVTDGWACFGSANFNKLSLRTNHEMNLATSDPGVVDALVRDLFEVDFAKSHELTEPVAVSWTDEIVDTILGQF